MAEINCKLDLTCCTAQNKHFQKHFTMYVELRPATVLCCTSIRGSHLLLDQLLGELTSFFAIVFIAVMHTQTLMTEEWWLGMFRWFANMFFYVHASYRYELGSTLA